MTAAATGYSLYSQREAAKAQEKTFQQAREQQDKQIHQSKSADADRRMRAARAEQARLRALSAESGVSGLSIDTVLRDVDFQAGSDIGMINLGRQNAFEESAMQHQSNNNSIRQPDYIGESLNAGLQIYSVGQGAGYWGQPEG